MSDLGDTYRVAFARLLIGRGNVYDSNKVQFKHMLHSPDC